MHETVGDIMSAKFGPAGNSNSFKEMGYKHSLEVPEYLVKMGLDHFEYQCGRGQKNSVMWQKKREFLFLFMPPIISLCLQ